MNLDYYNKVLQHFLQSKVVFKCENKTLKTGKITLFNVKQYFIKFYIETDKNEHKVLELPYPFAMYLREDGCCVLNYKLSCICNNIQPVYNMLKSCKTSASSKIYDSNVTIVPLN